MGFHQYLGIAVFVWARAFCGTRIGCYAAVGCSGSTQKILVTEIDVDQGHEHGWKYDGFFDPGTFEKDFGTLQGATVRADAQFFKIT